MTDLPKQPESPATPPSWREKISKKIRGALAGASMLSQAPQLKDENTTLEARLHAIGNLDHVQVTFKDGRKVMATELFKDPEALQKITIAEVESIDHVKLV